MRQTMPLPRKPAPRVARVKQHLPTDHIADVRGETRRKLIESKLLNQINSGGPGARVAITAGSRGIGGLLDLLAGVVDAVKERGGAPFIIPAMGSHGGATAEGQREILRILGVNETSVGAPIEATMETVELGRAENGAVAHVDKLAFEADGVIVLGRVKTHPESAAALASGLLKMATVGLGKQRGAQEAHNHGLWPSVRAVPKLQLAKSKILCGVAVVENAYRQPVAVEVAPPDYEAWLETDMRLLNTAKSHLAAIPFNDLDVLVVDEVGKDVSGAGMDPNIIGHWRITGGERVPNFRRIVALSLTAASLGNGIGAGLADFTTRRFVDAYDPAVSYVNILTASEPGGTTREGPMPLALASDREAIEVALFSSLAGDAPRLCRIRNTAALGEFWVSEAMMDEVKENPKLSVIEPLAPMAFDGEGNLFGAVEQ
ncbi:MAG: DUF362 domain-containing protein [Blastocatellales bacterium]